MLLRFLLPAVPTFEPHWPIRNYSWWHFSETNNFHTTPQNVTFTLPGNVTFMLP
jgi:hypothetical protein